MLVLLGRGAGDFSVVPALIVLFAACCWAFGSWVQAPEVAPETVEAA